MFVIIIAMFVTWPQRFSLHQVNRFCFKPMSKWSYWVTDLCIKKFLLCANQWAAFLKSQCYKLYLYSQKYSYNNKPAGLAKLKIFLTVEVDRGQQDVWIQLEGHLSEGFGHLRDITALRWLKASSTVFPARTLKTQTEEGDRSCAFVGLKTFVPW